MEIFIIIISFIILMILNLNFHEYFSVYNHVRVNIYKPVNIYNPLQIITVIMQILTFSQIESNILKVECFSHAIITIFYNIQKMYIFILMLNDNMFTCTFSSEALMKTRFLIHFSQDKTIYKYIPTGNLENESMKK